jgi:hypothetical protein
MQDIKEKKGKIIAKKVDKQKIIAKKVDKGRDYPLSATPKMEISPLDGKVYMDKLPVSGIKKNKY